MLLVGAPVHVCTRRRYAEESERVKGSKGVVLRVLPGTACAMGGSTCACVRRKSKQRRVQGFVCLLCKCAARGEHTPWVGAPVRVCKEKGCIGE